MMLIQLLLHQHHNVVTKLQEHCTNIKTPCTSRQTEDFRVHSWPSAQCYLLDWRLPKFFSFSFTLTFGVSEPCRKWASFFFRKSAKVTLMYLHVHAVWVPVFSCLKCKMHCISRLLKCSTQGDIHVRYCIFANVVSPPPRLFGHSDCTMAMKG